MYVIRLIYEVMMIIIIVIIIIITYLYSVLYDLY